MIKKDINCPCCNLVLGYVEMPPATKKEKWDKALEGYMCTPCCDEIEFNYRPGNTKLKILKDMRKGVKMKDLKIKYKEARKTR